MHLSCLEIVRLDARWEQELLRFLRVLQERGEDGMFRPHPFDAQTVRAIVTGMGQDLYYLMVDGTEVVGYGLLRGWNEGYEIPSLGIAIHPAARGMGLGRLMMEFLHAAAFRRGARRVRLRVKRSNLRAVALYAGMSYSFEDDIDAPDYLVGHKPLVRE